MMTDRNSRTSEDRDAFLKTNKARRGERCQIEPDRQVIIEMDSDRPTSREEIYAER